MSFIKRSRKINKLPHFHQYDQAIQTAKYNLPYVDIWYAY